MEELSDVHRYSLKGPYEAPDVQGVEVKDKRNRPIKCLDPETQNDIFSPQYPTALPLEFSLPKKQQGIWVEKSNIKTDII